MNSLMKGRHMREMKSARLLWIVLALLLLCLSPSRGAVVLEYDFNGNLNDSSGGGRNGTWTGGGSPQYSAGPLGRSAVYFDGAHYIKRSVVDTALQMSTMTLEAYIKPTALPGEQNILDFRQSNGGYDLRLGGNTAQLTIQILNYSGKFIQTPGEIVQDEWVHVAATRDSAGVSRIYLNEF